MVVLGAVDLKGMKGGRRRRAIRRGKKRNKRTSSFKGADEDLGKLAVGSFAWHRRVRLGIVLWIHSSGTWTIQVCRVFYKLPGTSTGKGG